MTFTDTALILLRRPWREHDRIYTLFTREHGKIDAVAQGTRKGRSKLAGGLEPYREVFVMCANGRRVVKIAQAATEEYLIGRAPSVLQVSAAGFASEVVDTLIIAHHRDAYVYDLSRDCLATIGRTDTPALLNLLLGRFTLRLMAHLGYKPELNRCVKCQDEVPPHPTPLPQGEREDFGFPLPAGEGGGEGHHAWALSSFRGGLVCNTCRINDPIGSLIPVNQSVLQILRAEDPSSITTVKPRDASALFSAANAFLSFRIEYPLKSAPVFVSVAGTQERFDLISAD